MNGDIFSDRNIVQHTLKIRNMCKEIMCGNDSHCFDA